jgi:cell division protein FtsW
MLKLERTLLFGVTILLCLVGILFVYESSATESFKLSGDQFHFALTQLLGFGVGLAALAGAYLLPPKFYLKFPYVLYLGSLLLIGLCFWDGISPLIEGNRAIYGARRWIWVLGVSVQVTEITKFCLIVLYAYVLPKARSDLVFLAYLALPAALIVWQHDLGTLLVICMMCFGMYYLSGAKIKRLFLLGGGLFVAALAFVLIFGYRSSRLTCWFQPDSDPDGACYHVQQMQIAIGRGGLMGKGIGGSVQKYHYIPEASSDSIFAIIAEEVGFVGVTLILAAYMFFLYLIFRIARTAQVGESERLIGYGIFLLFLSQMFVNLGAISGLIPLTGLTLPFFSAGGTSLVISLYLVGVVLTLTRAEPSVRIKHRKYV